LYHSCMARALLAARQRRQPRRFVGQTPPALGARYVRVTPLATGHERAMLPITRLAAAALWAHAGAATASEEACTCGNGKTLLFGPGGPHTALVPAAAIYNVEHPLMVDVEVCFGPEATWRDAALGCSSGLFAAAEQQMSGFLRVYSSVVDSVRPVVPITMHASVLIVQHSNPMGITGLHDVIAREGLRVVVNDGNFRDSLTSGTALWEDVVGRLGSVRATAMLRGKIVLFAAGSGEARDLILSGGADVWISWYDWFVANEEQFGMVPIEPELAIARDLVVTPTNATSAGGAAAAHFYEFLSESPLADAAM
jgi:accessory colonization factor AcfC